MGEGRKPTASGPPAGSWCFTRGATQPTSAARGYWTIRSAGIEKIAILNGGVNAWDEAGHGLTHEAPEIAPCWAPGTTIVSFCNTFALSRIADVEDVKLYPKSMVGWSLTHES